MRLSPLKLLHLSTTWIKLVRDPRDLDQVFSMADKLGDPALVEEIIVALKQHPRAQRAYEQRPRRGSVDTEALSALPDGSLGRAFADFLTRAGLDPADLPELPADDDASYTLAHLYETHDIWHVVTGFEPDVAGELGLQAFYLAQFPAKLPLVLLPAALLNTILYAYPDARRRMNGIVRGWLLGRRAKQLFGVDWKIRWTEPLSAVRQSLGIDLEEVFELVPVEQSAQIAA